MRMPRQNGEVYILTTAHRRRPAHFWICAPQPMRASPRRRATNKSPVTRSARTFSFISYRLRDLHGLLCFVKTKVVWGGRVWKYSSSSTSVSSSSKRTRRWWCRELRTRSSDLPIIIFFGKLNINENKLCSDAFNIFPDDFKIYYPVNISESRFKNWGHYGSQITYLKTNCYAHFYATEDTWTLNCIRCYVKCWNF